VNGLFGMDITMDIAWILQPGYFKFNFALRVGFEAITILFGPPPVRIYHIV